MAVVVEADASGRIVIPKNIRKELDIKERTKLLLTTTAEGLLLLQKLDVEKIARKLESEVAGKDIDSLVKSVRQEVNKKIKHEYPDLLT
jgi:AbrB family looped-hinge helix DNA binding protein